MENKILRESIAEIRNASIVIDACLRAVTRTKSTEVQALVEIAKQNNIIGAALNMLKKEGL